MPLYLFGSAFTKCGGALTTKLLRLNASLQSKLLASSTQYKTTRPLETPYVYLILETKAACGFSLVTRKTPPATV